MRLIDADALLERVWSEKIQAQAHGMEFSTCFMSPGGTPSTEWWYVEDLIENAPTIEPEPKWIPVTEKLPEEEERVLATHLGGVNPKNQVIEHIYQCGKFTCGWDMDMNVDSPTFGQRYMGKVIAWMPLPEPYREDGGAND